VRSSFFGLNVAITGLYAAQRNLDTVGHNLSNINTEGYSRQENIQRASRAMLTYNGSGMVGTGTEVISTVRIRDAYLDYKYWSENISLGEWEVKSTQLTELERLFNEPSQNKAGFNAIMDSFFNAISDLSKNPSDLSARRVVINRGVSMAKYFNSIATHLEKLQSDLNESVKLKVDEINALASQIAQLNQKIHTFEVGGDVANDLRDQRGVLVDKLSKIININVNEVVVGKLPNGENNTHFVITVSGKALVDHVNGYKLEVVQRDKKVNVEEDIDKLYDVRWEDGNKLEITGGELKGYLDMRDGNEGLDQGNGQSPRFKGIPFYIRRLNEFVRKFALAFNEGIVQTAGGTDSWIKEHAGHADGYGMQKPGTTVNPTGIRFFTMTGWSNIDNKTTELTSDEFIDNAETVDDIVKRYKMITAKNFSVSGDLLNQQYGEYNLAASLDSGLGEDNSNLLNFLDMRENSHLFSEGTPEDYMTSLIATLGIDSQQAAQFFSSQENLTSYIDNRRVSVSGVSINEEMANLVKFQQAYNASAKMITTMAEIYDKLINGIGV
jgi:flagellar hook-associated protein 1 FlgK